jgi:hypothetical protein
MAKAKLVTYFKGSLEDRPGALLAVAEDLKSKNLGLLALWAFGTQPGQGEYRCIPRSPDKFRSACKAAGMHVEEGTGVFVKGSDKTGALVKTLKAIAEEGVNITALHAIAVGPNYGSIIQVAPGDIEKAAKALGAK